MNKSNIKISVRHKKEKLLYVIVYFPRNLFSVGCKATEPQNLFTGLTFECEKGTFANLYINMSSIFDTRKKMKKRSEKSVFGIIN